MRTAWEPALGTALGAVMAISLAPTAAIAQTAPCQPPAKDEYLVLVVSLSPETQDRVKRNITSGNPSSVCRYLNYTVTRVGGFSSLEGANTWGKYLRENIGMPTFIVRPGMNLAAQPNPGPNPVTSATPTPVPSAGSPASGNAGPIAPAIPSQGPATTVAGATAADSSSSPSALVFGTPNLARPPARPPVPMIRVPPLSPGGAAKVPPGSSAPVNPAVVPSAPVNPGLGSPAAVDPPAPGTTGVTAPPGTTSASGTPAPVAAPPVVVPPVVVPPVAAPPVAPSVAPAVAATPVAPPVAPSVTPSVPASVPAAIASAAKAQPSNFNPLPLGGGYAVLVDFLNQPELAAQVRRVSGRDVGLVAYGQRPYLLALYTTDATTANATLQTLAERGFLGVLVDSNQVVLLRQVVAVE